MFSHIRNGVAKESVESSEDDQEACEREYFTLLHEESLDMEDLTRT